MQIETLANKSWVAAKTAGYTDPYAFTIDEDTGILIGYVPTYESLEAINRVIVPDVIRGVSCTSISSGVFNLPANTDKGITLVAGPKYLEELKDEAFAGCTSLTALLLYGEPPTVGFNVFNNVNPNLVIYRLATSVTTEWTTEFEGIPVVEVDNFQSVLDADRPKYLRDTTDNRLHEIRITNSTIKSGLIQ